MAKQQYKSKSVEVKPSTPISVEPIKSIDGFIWITATNKAVFMTAGKDYKVTLKHGENLIKKEKAILKK